MAKQDGNLIYVRFSDTDIVGLTTKSMNFVNDMIDITSQDSSGGWKEFLPGERGATISVNGLYSEGEDNGAGGAFDKLANGTSVSFKFGQKSTGTDYFSGTGYIQGLTIEGAKNAASSYSFEIQVTGAVSRTSN